MFISVRRVFYGVGPQPQSQGCAKVHNRNKVKAFGVLLGEGDGVIGSTRRSEGILPTVRGWLALEAPRYNHGVTVGARVKTGRTFIAENGNKKKTKW